MHEATIAGIIFLATYAIIVSEKVHRTAAALAGGLLMILLGIVHQEDAFHAIDLNVIFLLAGMMMIAAIMAETGIFQWLAVQAVRMGKGVPIRIMIILALITAVTSALLDNVTVVVLIAPVILFVASNLGVSPVPLLLSTVMASNIGGAATLIGDPPNIIIASAARIDFATFLINMGPPVIISLGAFCLVIYFMFRKSLVISPERRKIARRLQTADLITDRKLLLQSLFVLGLVLLAFLLHSALPLEPATVALAGATLLLIITRHDPQKVLEDVEWTTLMFFVGLFITVEAVVEVGWIERVASALLDFTAGNARVTTHLILWLSAIASGIVDNIPYTATMVPIVQSLGESMNITPLWWALAMGADFGGNLTLVGASANIVAANLAERAGYKLTFWEFLKYGIVTVLVSLVIATIWVELVFL